MGWSVCVSVCVCVCVNGKGGVWEQRPSDDNVPSARYQPAHEHSLVSFNVEVSVTGLMLPVF